MNYTILCMFGKGGVMRNREEDIIFKAKMLNYIDKMGDVGAGEGRMSTLLYKARTNSKIASLNYTLVKLQKKELVEPRITSIAGRRWFLTDSGREELVELNKIVDREEELGD